MKGIFKELIRAFGKMLGNKYLVLGIVAAVIMTMGGLQIRGCQTNKKLETYNRQLQGNLSDKEKELQQAHKDLGLSRSELISRDDLNDLLEKEKEELNTNFEKFKKRHNLQIKSRDRTIAGLKQQIKGGDTVVIVSPDEGCQDIKHCVISYSWEDILKRFKLKDPNIFEKGNETFESDQIFKIYGEVWEQKDGSLQTRRLVLREVYQDENGNYQPIPDAKANIIDSDFKYHNPPTIDTEWKWSKLFRLRAIAIPSVTAFPDNGRLRLGVGAEFLSISGFGINTHTAFDFKDVNKLEQRIGFSYNPKILGTELNLAIGASIGTPFADMFKEYSVNLDFIFYINN